jgi:polyhydroxybutyrate depolymerase
VPQPLSAAGCKQTFKAGDSVQSINSAGGTRSYRLHVPKQYKTGTPMALVLNFHGYGQSAAQQEKYSGLNAVADTQGFLVVTPEGSSSPQGWNIVGIYDEDGVDDVGFVRDMLSVLSNQLCIDQARIYATGHSNGGEMASQLACMLSDTIAAVAPVSGAVWQRCSGRAFPIISFQGTADQNVLYDWSAPTVTKVTAHVSRQNYQKCQADVVFYTIDGGGHTWPGSKVSGGAGPVTTEINASNLIWTFFLNHPKK